MQNRQDLLQAVDFVAEINHQTLKENEVEQMCLDLFRGWIGNSKFGLGYMFYLTRGPRKAWGDRFIQRLVEYMGSGIEKLSNEEVVSLMLMLYLKTKSAPNSDDVYDHLDPTILQRKVKDVIAARTNSDAELCAIFLGLRRLPQLTLDVDDLRDQVYLRLQGIGDRLSDP